MLAAQESPDAGRGNYGDGGRRSVVHPMSLITQVLAGLGLVVLAAAFLRLGANNRTEQAYVVVLEYGFALVLTLAGFGIVLIALLGV